MKRGSTFHAYAACTLAIVVAGIVFTGQPANGQKYPSQIIKIVVPSVAGGGTDVMTRVFARELEKSSWQHSNSRKQARCGRPNRYDWCDRC